MQDTNLIKNIVSRRKHMKKFKNTATLPVFVTLRKRDTPIVKIKKVCAIIKKRIIEDPIMIIVHALRARIKKVLNIIFQPADKNIYNLALYKLKMYKGKTIRHFVEKEKEKILALAA